MAIPGPSVLPASVMRTMQRDSVNIYEGEIVGETTLLVERLKRIAGTTHYLCMYASNGHGAWEAAIVNTLSAGDEVLCIVNGRFGHAWSELASGLGLKINIIDGGKRRAINPQVVGDALRRTPTTKAVLLTHTDTSTSVVNDVAKVRAAMNASGSEALLIVDCIASFGCDRFMMDKWGVDVMIAASQKGLMTPPGIGITFFNDKARKARRNAKLVTPYWDWNIRDSSAGYYQMFFGTAPTHTLYALFEATRLIEREGIENVWERHRLIAQSVHKAVEHWSQGGTWSLNAEIPCERSAAVTTILCSGSDMRQLRNMCEKELGLTLGIGIGMGATTGPSMEESAFRIGHMGHVNPPMILGTLGAVETSLHRLGIPFKSGGVAAAAEVLARF